VILPPKTLIEALQSALNYNNLNPKNAFDVILICRGGGSIEDLWAFNNESLAREIFDFLCPLFLVLVMRLILLLQILLLI